MKKARLRRIFPSETKKMILVAMDHGVGLGPVQGITSISSAIGRLLKSPVSGVILHKGSIQANLDLISKSSLGVILHVSASVSISPNPNGKVLVGSVSEALYLGADAVSVHVNLGTNDDRIMLKSMARISEECSRWNVPLLAMMYLKGQQLGDKNVAHAARVAMELGADIVKVSYTGSAKSFEKVVSGVSIPVVIAGGEKKGRVEDVFREIYEANQAGAAGVAIGRNLFQSDDPAALSKAIHGILNEGLTVGEAQRLFNSTQKTTLALMAA